MKNWITPRDRGSRGRYTLHKYSNKDYWLLDTVYREEKVKPFGPFLYFLNLFFSIYIHLNLVFKLARVGITLLYNFFVLHRHTSSFTPKGQIWQSMFIFVQKSWKLNSESTLLSRFPSYEDLRGLRRILTYGFAPPLSNHLASPSNQTSP